jgi:serine protease Do
VVTHVGKEKVSTTGQFRNLIAAAGADAKVELRVIRNAKIVSVQVELDALPKDGEEAVRDPDQNEKGSEIDGVTLTDLDDNLRKRLAVPPDLDGAVITRVAPGSKAAEAKLMPGDVVLQVDKRPVESAAEAHKRFSASKGPTLVQIFRRGARHFVVIK